MKRNWPTAFNDAILVKIQPSIFATVISGIFSVIMICVLPLFVRAWVNGKLPEEPGVFGFIIVFAFLVLFSFIAIGGFISSVKTHFSPKLKLLANKEGVFMDAYAFFSKGKAFFATWNDIVEIKQIDVEMGVGKGTRYTDIAISVILSEEKSTLLPKAIKGIGSTENSVAFEKRMIDADFDELLNKLQVMHRDHKNH